MFARIRPFLILACIGIGIAQQLSQATPPDSGLVSLVRSYKDRVSRGGERVDTAASMSAHRLAKAYTEQNDVRKADTQFALALQNAPSKQVAAIAMDYATFLSDTGDLRKAELILRQALTQSPDNKELTRMLARCLVLQEKVIEGLRYFKTIYSDAEAKAEVAAIYREQGDSDTLAAVERRWGAATTKPESVKQGTVRPEPTNQEPVLVAVTPKPATLTPTLTPRQIAPPELIMSEQTATPPPRLIVKAETATPSKPSVVPVLPPASVKIAPKTTFPQTFVAATPIEPLSKSEFFDTRVPIPVLRQAPLPVVATQLPKSAPLPMLSSSPKPAPVPMTGTPSSGKIALVNPVKLSATPVLSAKLPISSGAVHPRRHYIVNADTSESLDALFPIRPVAAVFAEEK